MPIEWQKAISKVFSKSAGTYSAPGDADEYGPFAERSIRRRDSQPPPTVPRPRRVVHTDLLAGINNVGLNVHRKLANTESGKNLVVSPISLHLAMALALLGAKGETRSEIAHALGMAGIPEGEWSACYIDLIDNLRYHAYGLELWLANSVWVTDTHRLLPEYEQAVRQQLAAEAISLPFSEARSVARINQWVAEKTNGKISDIINSLTDEQRLMLINCVYFKGLWYQPFDSKRTRDKIFHARSGDLRRPFMHMRNSFVYWENEHAQVVRLDYTECSSLSLCIFLPSQKTGLEEFVRNVPSLYLTAALRRSETRTGTLALPRFKLEGSQTLNSSLQAAGMKRCFDEQRADFSGMLVEPEPLCISEVLQKTYLEVNEQGTEAAAATRVQMIFGARESAPPKPFEMVVDRPFFVALGDTANDLLLFTASVWEV